MDVNSNYFHRVATGRRNRNITEVFTNKNGIQIIAKNDIKKEIKTEFEEKFQAEVTDANKLHSELQLIGNEVTREDNAELIKQVSNAEIKAAVFDMGAEKSPGPDGMPAGFYQKYWKIIGPSVTKVIRIFSEATKC